MFVPLVRYDKITVLHQSLYKEIARAIKVVIGRLRIVSPYWLQDPFPLYGFEVDISKDLSSNRT